MRPPASSKNPPNANRRPPRRRRGFARVFGSFSISRWNVGLSSRFRSIASFLLGQNRSFMGEILEHAIGRYAVIAFAQHGKQIRNDQQGGGSGNQEPADHGARERRVLLLARA